MKSTIEMLIVEVKYDLKIRLLSFCGCVLPAIFLTFLF